MLDPYRLSLLVEAASGQTWRWGPDSPDGRDIPLDLEFTTSLPGGFKDLSCSLLREIDTASSDNNLLDSVWLRGPVRRESVDGRKSAFEGFFSAFPRRHGDQFSVEPGGLGFSAVLGFFPAFQRIYVDRDLGAWTTMPLNRRATLGAGRTVDSDYSFSQQPGGGLAFQGVDAKAITINNESEAWYSAPAGIGISKLGYIGAEANTGNVVAATLYGDDNDALSGAITAALTLDSTLRTAVLAAAKRYLMLETRASATHTPAAGAGLTRRFAALAAYGNHGLTPRTIDASTPDGFYNCDIVADILAQTVAGVLNWTTGPGGSIEPNTIIVPHLAFKEPVTAMDALAKASGFGISSLVLPEWGVYDDRKFFWRSPDPDRLCWQARLMNGAKPIYEGTQSDDLIGGVVVQYTDPSGIQKIVGPPAAYWPTGTAIADATDPSLIDTSATNPVNMHSLGPKWEILQLTQPCTQAMAITLGALYLAIRSLPQRRGSIELTGLVGHPTMAQDQPVYKVRAGDWIQLTDSGTPTLKRRIISSRYQHATRSNVVDVDNRPFTLDALLEVLQADMVGTFG